RRERERVSHGPAVDGWMGVLARLGASGEGAFGARGCAALNCAMRPNPDQIAAEARNYAAHEVLRDGGSIHIRAIRADAKARLLEHFRHLSQDSIYHRFFGLKHSLTDQDLMRFTEVDFINHVALVATLIEDGAERFIGVGRYVSSGPERAEVA